MVLAALGLAVPALTRVAAGAPACSGEGGETVSIAAVHEDWSLGLADGRSIRLVGVDPVEATPTRPAADVEARAQLAGWLVGRSAVLVPAGAGLDRWGRSDGLVFAAAPGAETSPLSVGLALVDAGLARGRVEPAAAACWAAVGAAEAAARAAGLGLWADPAYAVHHPGDAARLQAALGTMVLVEGRVTRVGRGRSRLFIGLREAGGETTISLANRDLFILDQLGLNDTRLVGTTIRVRGDLEDRRGFSIDVTDAAQIEVLDRGMENKAGRAD